MAGVEVGGEGARGRGGDGWWRAGLVAMVGGDGWWRWLVMRIGGELVLARIGGDGRGEGW